MIVKISIKNSYSSINSSTLYIAVPIIQKLINQKNSQLSSFLTHPLHCCYFLSTNRFFCLIYKTIQTNYIIYYIIYRIKNYIGVLINIANTIKGEEI